MRASEMSVILLIFLVLFGLASCLLQETHDFFKAPTNALFKRSGRADPDDIHEVVFALKQGLSGSELEDLLLKVSTPGTSHYGAHLTRNEIGELTRPSALGVSTVKSWLTENGFFVTDETIYGEYLIAQGTIKKWEEALNAVFFKFETVNDKLLVKKSPSSTFIRTLSVSLPDTLTPFVTCIFNTVDFPTLVDFSSARVAPTKATDEVAQSDITVDDAITIANFPPGINTPYFFHNFTNIGDREGNNLISQAVYEMNGQIYSTFDLSTFQEAYQIPRAPVTNIHGYNETYCTNIIDCDEGNLDIQWIMAVARNTPTTWYYNNAGNFANWIVQVANMTNPPHVFSLSWGSTDAMISQAEANTFNQEAMKLGVQGVSIFAASGDWGAGGLMPYVFGTTYCGFNTMFPSSSPYVTAVGATQGPESGDPEVVCQSQNGAIITSGGGFSSATTASTPSWQFSVVQQYFQNLIYQQQTNDVPPPTSGYNPYGRAVPDISSLGYNYVVVINGTKTEITGTSASTPAIAGMFSLVNAERRRANLSTVGWINPALYQTYEAYTQDIVSGSTFYTSIMNFMYCGEGFHALPGWDPATGLGSLRNVSALVQSFMSIANPAPTPVPPPALATTTTTTTTAVYNSASSSSHVPVSQDAKEPKTSHLRSSLSAETATASSVAATESSTTTAYTWYYQNYYMGNETAPEALFRSSWYPVNKCLPLYNASGSVMGYTLIECLYGYGSSTMIVQNVYTAPTCSSDSYEYNSPPMFGNVAASVQSPLYVYPSGYISNILDYQHAIEQGCVSGASPSPVFANDAEVTIQQQYVSSVDTNAAASCPTTAASIPTSDSSYLAGVIYYQQNLCYATSLTTSKQVTGYVLTSYADSGSCQDSGSTTTSVTTLNFQASQTNSIVSGCMTLASGLFPTYLFNSYNTFFGNAYSNAYFGNAQVTSYNAYLWSQAKFGDAGFSSDDAMVNGNNNDDDSNISKNTEIALIVCVVLLASIFLLIVFAIWTTKSKRGMMMNFRAENTTEKLELSKYAA